MGFLDKISETAKAAAQNAMKAAEKISVEATKVSQDAIKNVKEISDKASEGISEFSHKAAAEGKNLSDKVGMSASELSTWAQGMPDKLRATADDFDADALWDKITNSAAKAGQELIVMVLTIYYAIESKITGNNKSQK